MKEVFTNLLKIKSIITLVLLGLLVYCVVTGIVEGEYVKTIFTTVIGFYFGTQFQKGVNEISALAQNSESEDQ